MPDLGIDLDIISEYTNFNFMNFMCEIIRNRYVFVF
jgi:hypothetical protein